MAFIIVVNWCKSEIPGDFFDAGTLRREALCKRRLLPCRHEVRRGHGVGQRVTAYPLTRHITFRFYVVAHICRIPVKGISTMTGYEAGVSVRAWFCDACTVGLVVG